jgi:hypothetical protein
MAISVGGLMALCSKNLVELKFIRRDKTRRPTSRRMLCTLDRNLLNSTFGINILNFKKPRYRQPYNAASRGLATVWDIIMQDWRNIPTESVEVVTVTPTIPMKNFLLYFDSHIKVMTTAEKQQFMDK